MTAVEPKKRGPYKPRQPKVAGEEIAKAPAAKKYSSDCPECGAVVEINSLDLGLLAGGVSATWLAHVFGHDKNTIKKKLAKCPVYGMNGTTPLYLIKDAAQWLVAPKVDLMQYIHGLRPQDMPPQLNDAYWSAMGKRQKVLENAGDLWRTDDVLRVFGEAALKIKSTVQLWVDELDRQKGVTNEQRNVLVQLSDGLLQEVHRLFVTAPQEGRTLSTMSEHVNESESEAYDDIL